MNGSISENVRRIRDEIQAASGGRSVLLIGVTKTVEPARIQQAFEAGLRVFGENRVQEGVPKIVELASLGATWHFIGHLQTNKVRDAVRNFSMIQSVDSLKLLHEIEKEAAKQQKKMQLLLEVNLGGEGSKHGFPPDSIPASFDLEWCTVRGLMAIPPFFEDPEKVRPYFRKLRELRDELQLQELSMGMSNDYMVAVSEGATMVRIGTAIFGERKN